jgi:alpha-beta hydrolase superfamily lysophospholipase
LSFKDTPPVPASSALPLPTEAEERWLASADGERLFYRYWPGEPGKPVVVYFHGIEGHGAWFAGTAAHLNALGMSVYVPDRRGAGRNAQERGHLASCAQLLGDMDLMLAAARKENRQEALFVVANCWAAKAAVLLAGKQAAARHGLAGLVLTSPAVAVKIDADLKTKLTIGLAWLCGSKRKFAIPLSAEMFTDNPAYLEFIRQDRLRLTEATGSFFATSTILTLLAGPAAASVSVPLLVLQSGRDRIVCVDGVARWFQRVGVKDKTLHMFPEAEHSLDFDARPEAYLRTLADWLVERSRRRSL